MTKEANALPALAAAADDSSLAAGEPDLFPIVGVGASAGGLEAFRRLLGALPNDTGMAYVFVQHLDPTHDSILAGLLSEVTRMPVAEVKNEVRVEPNHVYVIPPSKVLILAEGMLKLVPRAPPGSMHLPVDSFLRTLAEVRGSQAIGVVLSGMGSDGTLGLKAIEAEGGITFAQQPESAKNEDMPRSAIAAGGVDFVLSPEDIARELTRLGRHPYLAGEHPSQVVPPPASGEQPLHGGDDALLKVLDLLRTSSGTDFGAYKKTTLRRRIARRMAVTRIDTLQAYADRLERDAAEASALYDDCLISVTSFFRDPEVFAAMSQQVLPALLKQRQDDTSLRMWVPGCATGEEVYSIAMCVLESAGDLSRGLALQIFATDLSEAALAKAREGRYLMNIARDVSQERLRRFFNKVGDGYQINKSVREMCIFARHDLTRDPPYSRMDLISCRNLLIYLEPSLQETVFSTFHYALRPDGYLLVGPAETPGASSALFSVVDERQRLYKRNTSSTPPRLLSAMRDKGPSWTGVDPSNRKIVGASEVPREADRMLLARFAPAGVVVDANLNVLEFRGDTDPFLDHGHGKATLSLERLLRRGLLMELRQAIEEARSSGAAVRKEGLRVRHRQQLQDVSIEVCPIKGRAANERCLLILFETDGTPQPIERASSIQPLDSEDSKDFEITRLTQSLTQTTEYMHTLVGEHEAALEELQSTTEETLSSNEELQSLNEELQTAKEEIQSANEELATLNQELQDRNAQLARSNEHTQRGLDSANALVDAVPHPLVILDGELRIEKANVAFYETFAVAQDRTVNRLLSEVGHAAWAQPALLEAVKRVLRTGTTLQDVQVNADFPGIGLRSLCLNARRLPAVRETGERILLAIEDRTVFNRVEREREALLVLEHNAREQAEAADKLKDQFVATVSHELRGPLTVISGWMNILVGAGPAGADSATLAKALSAIGRGVTAQSRLISDLLDHSRLVTGKVELQRAAIDLMVVAEAAMVGVRAAAQAKDITLQLSAGSGTSIVLGDADRMQQVLWNLFLNAVKFTPIGGKVTVVVARVGNQVHVTVTDTGRGITGDFLPHVFERFRQAEGSSNRTQPGLGLGLTLVRELVELHGGTVRAESPGKDLGATFTVTLPIPAVLLPAPDWDASPDSAPPSIPPSFSEVSAPPNDVLSGLLVLVVDDEADAREALVGLLERYGAEVHPAASVADAIAALETKMPDVLVSDIGMPGEDGYELIRRVNQLCAESGRALPSLAVSAYATHEHRKKILRYGFQKHLEKPVAPSELVTAVARLAGRSVDAKPGA